MFLFILSLQFVGSVFVVLGTWLAVHKNSFIAVAAYAAHNDHIEVRKILEPKNFWNPRRRKTP